MAFGKKKQCSRCKNVRVVIEIEDDPGTLDCSLCVECCKEKRREGTLSSIYDHIIECLEDEEDD